MKIYRSFWLPAAIAAGVVLAPLISAGQAFRLLRFDDDYSQLRKDSSSGFYGRLKSFPLPGGRDVYAAIGGEIRYEYARTRNEDWQANGEGRNQTLFQRYMLFADVRAGRRWRLFAQLNSALAGGNKNTPRLIDEDRLVVQNLFIDFQALRRNYTSLTLRLGRQELDYGTGRLVSVRDGNNARQYFTGGKVMFAARRFSIDGFVMMADSTRRGVFDNRPTGQTNLWGVYAKVQCKGDRHFDCYYLGIRRNNSPFNEGVARELRHTAAVRHWKNSGRFIYNLEAAYQSGRFGEGRISAWTLAMEAGYVFDNVRFRPTINLRNDYISGDRREGDGSLQTFNPVYPKGGYFGFNPRIGPANLIDLHPYVTLGLTEKVGLQADAVFNWRYSLGDGVYRPGGTPEMAAGASRERYIGAAYLLSLEYAFNRFLQCNAGAQYFRIGDFLEDRIHGPSSSFFYNVALAFKF